MSSQQEVGNVKAFLEQKHIATSYDWVEACVNFVKQEHNQNLTLQNLKNFVYQQWLTADLEEIGVACLPSYLPTTQKTSLNGCFVLQVDGIRDVGKPAYSQLKELERTVNTNADFTAAPETTLAPWEAKPTRMLMLNLTDGCIHVQGMEYKQITSLSPNLPPGVKVEIQGPVDCRFGVLMLTSENIRVLGGEVESKLVQYSRRTILREILQLPTEGETEPNSETVPEETLLNTDSSISSSTSTLPISAHVPSNSSTLSSWSNNTTQQINANVSRPSNVPSSRNQRTVSNSADVRNNFGRSAGSHPLGQNSASRSQNDQNRDLDDFDAFEGEDDFVDGLDCTVLDEIEKETLNKSESFEHPDEMQEDVWLEDEDVVQDLMAFQDEDPGFQMPFEEPFEESHSESLVSGATKQEEPISYLSYVLQNPEVDRTITIKGFIVKVLSKLECTTDNGWSLMVKINDGKDSLDVVIHDKVIEGIIGISAPTMVKMQLNADTPEKRKEVVQAISKFKATLQDYNCLMDVKLSPGSTPCLIKCSPLDQLQQQQLLERMKSHS